jgi:adenosyl cobinamide kinase/adenosyl cobinamide phosphate guanylyltransferase
MELWIKDTLSQEEWRERLEKCMQWEREITGRQLVVIGSDITKGIVPIDKEDRKWRDMTGWVYQDIVKKSERVDLIWYGINQQLKYGGMENEDIH